MTWLKPKCLPMGEQVLFHVGEDPIHQLSEMLANRAIVVTNTPFSWSSWLFPFALLLWALKTQVTFLLAGPTLYVFQVLLHSLCAFLLLKHILLRSISLFRLLFKSLFSFCLKKMVRSIIVKGGVSRERVVVKDSNDFSRLSGHWSRSVILTLTATNSLRIFSILSKCWDTLVPSCLLPYRSMLPRMVLSFSLRAFLQGAPQPAA